MKIHYRYSRFKNKVILLLLFQCIACAPKNEVSLEKTELVHKKESEASSKTEEPKKKPMGHRKSTRPPPDYVKDWKEVHPRTTYHILAGQYLWLLGEDRMEVRDNKSTRDIYYKTFAPDPCPKPKERKPKRNADGVFSGAGGGTIRTGGCTPLPKLYGVNSWKSTLFGATHSTTQYPPDYQRPRGFGFLNGQVFITLTDGTYFFEPDGTFKEKRKLEIGWERSKDPYANPGWKWTPEEDHLFYKKRKIKAEYGAIFSGPVVGVLQRPSKDRKQMNGDEEIIDLTFFDRKSGKLKKQFSDLEKMMRFPRQMHIREHEAGVYLYKHVDRHDPKTRKNYYLSSIYEPFYWIGEDVIDLQSDGAVFCYVYLNEKKCLPNPAYLIEYVVENEHALYVMSYDKVYVQRK